MDPAEIDRIVSAHHLRPYWVGCAVHNGCTCGSYAYPCGVLFSLRTRLEIEQQVRANTAAWRFPPR